MRRELLIVLFAGLVGCGDNSKGRPDAGSEPTPDAPPDAPIPDGILEARAAAAGTGLSLKINNVTVTYLKPVVPSSTDPAGFNIQAKRGGPALFVAVDPTTLNPAPAVGDVVSFTITTRADVNGEKRATAITDFTRSRTGTNVTDLAENISAAADVLSALDNYDAELVAVTGTIFENFAGAGGGFQSAGLSTTGVANNTDLEIRVPLGTIDAIDMTMGCQVTALKVPMGRFNTRAQIGVFSPSDVTMTGCAAPSVASVVALTDTSIRITFTRRVLATSVNVNGSQFTFDNGLTASAAAVSGRTVTVTTSAQTGGTTYALTVASSVTDLQGTAMGTPNTGSFSGFVVQAVVRINEVNANIASSCDMIELRVVSGGSMAGYKLQERNGGTGELVFTFPAGVTMQTNDLIVVHTMDMNTPATCNPNAASQETTAPNQQPVAMFANNFDTAFDFWATDNGLTNTTNVFSLRNAAGDVLDAIFVTDGSNAAGATLTAAGPVGAANQWMPAQAAYTAADFLAAAVPGLGTTGTTQAGASIQRLDNTDEHDKADWTAAPQASTWGALNMNQTAF